MGDTIVKLLKSEQLVLFDLKSIYLSKMTLKQWADWSDTNVSNKTLTMLSVHLRKGYGVLKLARSCHNNNDSEKGEHQLTVNLTSLFMSMTYIYIFLTRL